VGTSPRAVSAVQVTGLRKSYGSRAVLRGVDLTIAEGEVFALLGPNGAGKTTTVEILEGHRERDAGDVSVLGVDPARAGEGFRAQIGIVLQSNAVYPRLRVDQMLRLFAGYYTAPREPEEVLGLVGLSDEAGTRVGTLSGGQLRRLDLALALIGDPRLVFLDEPTTGFDPAARRRAWGTIADLRQLGKTILLTTHYLDEAQHLADRIAILRNGEIAAEGTPDELLAQTRTTEVRYRLNGEVVVHNTDSPTRLLGELTAGALARGEELEELELRRPTLEDFYLELVDEQD
jgi:ABC-2 type transport system ATP-binding protein